MGYSSLHECVDDLARAGQLVRIETEVDAHLEIAEIQRRLYQAAGPAVLLTRIKDCRFPMLANLFGTRERTHYLFRDALEAVRRLVQLKTDPAAAMKRPWQAIGMLPGTLNLLPKWTNDAAVLACQTTIDQLPQQTSWPLDGGAFITLPQVYSEDPRRPGWRQSNLGMYRVQISGGQYEPNCEIGLHYQIHRGIGVHHAAALELGVPLRVHIHVGGPPAMTVAAVMPLPEGLPELAFAGVLGGRRVRLANRPGELPGKLPILADADFCITGTIDPTKQLSEGPFGDHLGYYSLAHDFPVLRVEHVYHRHGAIWPFTVVGRPPQEDTSFGELIHELTGPVIPTVVPGVSAVHAVDAAGVHPLLLVIGSERYVPYAERRQPQELLTQANAILGQGQMSLAKYLLIVDRQDDPQLDIHDVAGFLQHVLARFDPMRDLHFQTRTTIDTLDYSGTGLNEGSKVVVAAAGPPRRTLPNEIPSHLRLPDGFASPRVCLPGVLAIESPPHESLEGRSAGSLRTFCEQFTVDDAINRFPLVVLVDNSEFVARTLNNFIWTTFTRSNPAVDIDGVAACCEHKHWGCRGSLVIDARAKSHHAPPLVEDPAITRRVDALAARGGPLHGII
jgi:4-hydroxy-3-polyprenylbenzoate decarboxylase